MKHNMQELSATELEAVCGGDMEDIIENITESIMNMLNSIMEAMDVMTDQELLELYEMLQNEDYAL